MFPRQLFASVVIALCLLAVIVRLVQRGHLDIAYCWLWLGIGVGTLLVVLHYDWLLRLSDIIGAVAPTTTLFLLGFLMVMLLCLQFSMVVSTHRRQIKRLTQRLAILEQTQAPTVEKGSNPDGRRPT